MMKEKRVEKTKEKKVEKTKEKMETSINLRNHKRISRSQRLRLSNQRPKRIPSRANQVLNNTDKFGTTREEDGTPNGSTNKTDFGKISS